MGCGVDWSGVIKEGEESMGKRGREKEGKEGGGRVFFTKNGEMLGMSLRSLFPPPLLPIANTDSPRLERGTVLSLAAR